MYGNFFFFVFNVSKQMHSYQASGVSVIIGYNVELIPPVLTPGMWHGITGVALPNAFLHNQYHQEHFYT